MRSLGVVPKLDSRDALALSSKVLEYAEERGLRAYLDARASEYIDWGRTFSLGSDPVDVVAVIGGDGTILRTLHTLKDMEVPMITIRHGKRGFLADVPPYDYAVAIDRLIEGRYSLHEYMRLSVLTEASTRLPYALNDAAVVTSPKFRGKVSRLRIMREDSAGNVEKVVGVVGDGVIVSTPVGSTAYSLAAGGPVVDPLMKLFIVTPLAPISLCSRPVVLPEDSKVVVEVEKGSHEVELFIDGVASARLEPGESLSVVKAPKPARIIRFFTEEYFSRVFERCL